MPSLVLICRENSAAALGPLLQQISSGADVLTEIRVQSQFKIEQQNYLRLSIHLKSADTKITDAMRAIILRHASALAAYAILPEQGLKVALAFFDTDSTFINQEVIDELADFAGFKKQVAEITERAMQGELDFNSALAQRVSLLKGLPEATLAEVKRARLTLTPGAADLVAALHAQDAKTYLLSGGFSFFTSAFRHELHLTGDSANELEIVDGILTGRTIGEIVNREKKAALLRTITAAHKADLRETIAVGDGANDIDMVHASGLGIAFCAKPALVGETFAAIFERDLRLVLNLVSA